MQDTVGAQSVETKTRVFISYSRKDMAFANKLEPALKARGFEVLIDREEIYAFEDWWKRIEALVGSADTVVFVLSPDAVVSDVALKEVAYAASLNKRFAPIVCRRVEASAVPEVLRRLNFIFFDEPDRFDDSANKLAEGLQTDIVWIRDHTKFGEAARAWVAAARPNGLLLRTPALEMAEYWMASRPRSAPDPTEEIKSFVAISRQVEVAAGRRSRILNATLYTLLVGIILGLVGWINQDYLKQQINWYWIMRPYRVANVDPYVLKADVERTLKPLASFRECAKDCPEMIVIPAGSFMMGSPASEPGHNASEAPQHMVTIARPFAVSKFDVTFADFDACLSVGGCPNPSDSGGGRGTKPVINVDWDDAQKYVAWLSEMTGKTYRLLTEAEWEYAARAGTTTAYYWGGAIGKANALCLDCGSRSDSQTASVGSYPPNAFGLYDMAGNVWQWVQDCYHADHNGAPTDGSARTSGDCSHRVLRGGSWNSSSLYLRSAARVSGTAAVDRVNAAGFRVARTLAP